MRYALIKNGVIQEFRDYSSKPSDIAHKNVVWKEAPIVVQPSFNHLTEIVEGPTYDIQPTEVIEQWTKRNLTAQEISDRKDSSVNTIQVGDAVLLNALTLLENEIRELRGKVNTLIDGGSPSKWSAGSVSSVTANQVKTYIRNNL